MKSVFLLVDELLKIFTHATNRRLVADVALGAFLSGGLDSSTFAALSVRGLPVSSLETFTVGFRELSFDESPFAAQVADFLKTNHHTDTLSLEGVLAALPQILDRLDEPQGDSSLLPSWLLSRFARTKVTVALSGDGGDELIAGYDPSGSCDSLRSTIDFSNENPRSLL